MAIRKKNYKDYGVGHEDRDEILANYNVARPTGRASRTMEMKCTAFHFQAFFRSCNR
jgi:hypothetical protein